MENSFEFINKGFIRSALFMGVALFLAGCSWGDGDKIIGGVLKSTDGGVNFERKNTINEKENIQKVNVLSIAIDPTNSQYLILGTEELGIFVSENSGETWQKVSNALKVYDIVFNPADPQIVYATGFDEGQGKILKSNNKGKEWSAVYGEPKGESMILSLAVDSFDPNVVFAGSTQGLILKTENAGRDWESIGQLKDAIMAIELDKGDTRDIYFLVSKDGIFKIDHSKDIKPDDKGKLPKNENQQEGGVEIISLEDQVDARNLFVLKADIKKPKLVFAAGEDGLFKSEDGGNSWEKIPTLLSTESSDKLTIRSLAIVGQDSQLIYFSVRGVFYKSEDGGNSWQTFEINNKNAVGNIAVDPTNEQTIYLGIREIQ